ncbi:MAG: hypothetical protein GQE15_10680 [Archangiaceae bacterium]|nr:hypothetical protein [Archangiaceae bacterium]
MPRPQTLSVLRWDVRELQKKLKKLGVTPPPPKGAKALADIMKPGKFYVAQNAREPTAEYLAQLQALVDAQETRWTPEAYLHNVMAAALAVAPPSEQLDAPHGRVPARPVIDNHGYLALALLAAEHVSKKVPEAERARFTRWVELGQRVAKRQALSARDEALLTEELPYVRLPSRAISRAFTATSPCLRVAQGVGLEAEEADAHNVGGKGAREACARAVEVLSKSSGAAKKFLTALDALILLEDAKLRFGEVSAKPSAAVVASRWRGAEKGKGSHWVVELTNGNFALLWKVKGKWRLVEGGRDEVLASVPDAHFKAATQALLG